MRFKVDNTSKQYTHTMWFGFHFKLYDLDTEHYLNNTLCCNEVYSRLIYSLSWNTSLHLCDHWLTNDKKLNKQNYVCHCSNSFNQRVSHYSTPMHREGHQPLDGCATFKLLHSVTLNTNCTVTRRPPTNSPLIKCRSTDVDVWCHGWHVLYSWSRLFALTDAIHVIIKFIISIPLCLHNIFL